MAGMVGADPEELDALAQRFRVLAGRLDSSRASLGSQIHNSPWAGPAAEGFRHDWDGHHSRVLTAVARSLGQAADSLARNADEQRQASGSAFTGGNRGVATSPGPGSPTAFVDSLGHVVEAATAVGPIATLLANSGHLLKISKFSVPTVASLFKNGEKITSKSKLVKGISFFGAGIATGTFLYNLANHASTETTVLAGAQAIGSTMALWPSPIASPVGAAIADGAKFADDIYAHKSGGEKVWDGVQLGADVVGTALPPVFWAKEAFIGGMAIGSLITEIPAVKTSISDFNDSVFTAGAHAVHGDPNSDPAAAARLVARYSSDPVGLGNYFFDSGSAFLTKIGFH
jgi:uncharacterized protein YukE